MSLSTHILDTSAGRPVAGVRVIVSIEREATWHTLHTAVTDTDGRARFTPAAQPLEPGLYRLRFETAAYFAHTNTPTLYPFIEITFHTHAVHASDQQPHLHIPLLLTANGYTTYRGS